MPEDPPAPKQAVEFDQAIAYVNKIKTRFASDERVYKAFLEILNMYRKGQKTIANVYDEVALLFRNHRDLLDEFTYFLPDASPPGGGGGGIGARRGGGAGRGRPGGRGLSEAGVLRKLHARKAARGGEAGDYGPRSSLAREAGFFDRVKARVRSRDTYQDFLKCLNLFAQEIITKAELVGMVSDMLGRFPDLLAGFHDFLARCEALDDGGGGGGGETGRGRRGLARGLALGGPSLGEKYVTRPISELDVSSWERCTTSYVKLPPATLASRAQGAPQLARPS